MTTTLTLKEQGIPEEHTITLKKKFFLDDAYVTKGDVMQLHLLYVQVYVVIVLV